jgi:hypothetical protein
MNLRKISVPTTRNAWLEKLYDDGILVANEESRNLSDKLYAARRLQEFLGDSFTEYHPKTLGLKELALKYNLVNCPVLAPMTEIQKAFRTEFPQGFIVKPCAVINTGGETEGNYFFEDDIWAAFLTEAPLAKAVLQKNDYVSKLLKTIVSGEEYIVQENISTKAGYSAAKAKTYAEVRVHTYEGKAVYGGLFSRWAVSPVEQEDKFFIAESLVQKMLNQIPADYLRGFAWGLDVMVFDNGYARIVDINTNRGQRSQWSGYLSRPPLMGAYTRTIEKQRHVRFAGLNGVLLRNNLGNYWKYKKKYYLEGIR